MRTPPSPGKGQPRSCGTPDFWNKARRMNLRLRVFGLVLGPPPLVGGAEAERGERRVPGAQRSGLERPPVETDRQAPVEKDRQGAVRRRSSAAGSRCLRWRERPARGGRHNKTGCAIVLRQVQRRFWRGGMLNLFQAKTRRELLCSPPCEPPPDELPTRLNSMTALCWT